MELKLKIEVRFLRVLIVRAESGTGGYESRAYLVLPGGGGPTGK